MASITNEMIIKILTEVRANSPNRFYSVVKTLADQSRRTPDEVRAIYNESLEGDDDDDESTCDESTRDEST